MTAVRCDPAHVSAASQTQAGCPYAARRGNRTRYARTAVGGGRMALHENMYAAASLFEKLFEEI